MCMAHAQSLVNIYSQQAKQMITVRSQNFQPLLLSHNTIKLINTHFTQKLKLLGRESLSSESSPVDFSSQKGSTRHSNYMHSQAPDVVCVQSQLQGFEANFSCKQPLPLVGFQFDLHLSLL